ncbi:MAG: ATP-binding protein [Propionicimonas sp.]
MTVLHPPVDTTGTLAVDGRNIFGILKEALYGEDDIVFRELISNACDAIAKRTATGQEFTGRVEVTVDPAGRRIVVADNGIGMSGEEVRHYINQIALSGTAEFVRDAQLPEATIGHFGVGFYSAFMLADTVELQTCSATGADPVGWLGDSEMNWRIEPGRRSEPGTSVILRLAPDSPYLTEPEAVTAAVRKYFPFPALAIQLTTPTGTTSVGDPAPAWRLPEGEAGDAELNAFYRDHFGEPRDPLGWVRIESPELGLRGMVFLRDTNAGVEAIDGRVDVISRGVWLGSDLTGLIPKFVNLQHAVIECDQLDLVVSRSQLRATTEGDAAALVSECLSQELAIALYRLFTEQRARYEQLWPEIAPFVKYGVLTDRIFASVMTRKVLFADLGGELWTVGEYLTRLPEKFAGTVFYTTDPVGQAGYVQAFRAAGIPALVLDHVIDQPLLQRLELISKEVGFSRLDADLLGVLATEPEPGDTALAVAVTTVFTEVAARRLPEATVRAVSIAAPGLSVTLTVPEVERRLEELRLVSGLAAGRIEQAVSPPRTLLVNLASPLVRGLADAPAERAALAAEQLVDLVLLGQDELTPEAILAFSARTENLLAGYLGAATTDQE